MMTTHATGVWGESTWFPSPNHEIAAPSFWQRKHSFHAYMQEGGRLDKYGQYKEAIQQYENAMAVDPWRYKSYVGIAAAHVKLGNLDEAEHFIDLAAHKTRSTNEEFWVSMVHATVCFGRFEKSHQEEFIQRAIRKVEHALTLEPSHIFALGNNLLMKLEAATKLFCHNASVAFPYFNSAKAAMLRILDVCLQIKSTKNLYFLQKVIRQLEAYLSLLPDKTFWILRIEQAKEICHGSLAKTTSSLWERWKGILNNGRNVAIWIVAISIITSLLASGQSNATLYDPQDINLSEAMTLNTAEDLAVTDGIVYVDLLDID
jgi:tetratricopeptide (TPR) repeat protein